MVDSLPHFMIQNDTTSSNLISNRIQIPIPSLKDKYVAIIPNAFSEDECKQLINFSENIGYKEALVNLGFGYKDKINEFRNHEKLSIDNTKMADYIFNRIESIIPKQFDNRTFVNINERLRFLRYSPQQYFGAHYDGMYRRDNGQRSLITIIIYLNDNYNGGQFTFLHPTNEHKTHSIKPKTGMILLFEQNELYHQGSMVLNNNQNENIFKYCIRSDLMYSNKVIDVSKVNNNRLHKSYEVEKQKIYFERNQSIKSSSLQPHVSYKVKKMNKLCDDSITTKVIYFWVGQCFESNEKVFPYELFEIIAKYCRIIGVLDFVCDPNKLHSLATIAETAERYDEMLEVMVELIKLKSRVFKCKCNNVCDNEICEMLNKDQRNSFSVACKNVIGAKRMSWRTINGFITGGETDEITKLQLDIVNKYIRVVEVEIHEICVNILDLLENYILDKIKCCSRDNANIIVFYKRMAGNYNRYLCEIFPTTTIYKEKAGLYYGNAYKLAKEKLIAAHPQLLGLCLNYGVYLYEIENDSVKACDITKTAFDNAIEGFEGISEEYRSDSTCIMRILRDNLTLWMSESTNDDNQ